jgi:antirestriction protein ArdC
MEERVAEALGDLTEYRQESGIRLTSGGDRAYYAPASDSIRLPRRVAFRDDNAFVGVAAHEHVHSTGHKDRLARPELYQLTGNTFGSEPYAREELVAEMGTAMFLARHRLDTPDLEENSAAYIASWLKALKDDKRLVVSAAARASAAVDLLADGADDNDDTEGTES